MFLCYEKGLKIGSIISSLRALVSRMKPDFFFFSIEVRIFFLWMRLSALTTVIRDLHLSVVHNIYLGTLLWVCISLNHSIAVYWLSTYSCWGILQNSSCTSGCADLYLDTKNADLPPTCTVNNIWRIML